MLSNFVFDLFAGTSTATRQLRRRVLQLANYNFNVLISGPIGSGKRKLAEAVHRHSPRADGPFIPVDCGALSGPFFQSQVFGQTADGNLLSRGSTIGCLRAAHQGSLLLRNVDRLTMDEQAALAVALRTKCVESGGESHQIDVRIVATSSRDLEKQVRCGCFRVDLYFLLSTTTIECPALVDRSDDIPALVSYFLAKQTFEHGVECKQISAAALALLKSYSWPGNIGQLEASLESAIRAGEGESTLDLAHFTEIAEQVERENLPNEYGHHGNCGQHEKRGEVATREFVNGVESVITTPLVDGTGEWMTLAEAESLHIRRTLEQANFNAPVAAAMLGLSLRAFRQKLQRYRLQHFLRSSCDKM